MNGASSTPPRWPYERLRRRKDWAITFVKRDLWLLELNALPSALAFLTRVARVLLLTVRGFYRDRCLQQAAALTYNTIFSLPWVLAFAFAMAKGFNLYGKLKADAIEPFLDATFGERATGAAPELRNAVDQIFTYVETSDLSALGGVALALVLYSVIKLLGAVEGSLNDIWGVRRARTIVRRVSDYLALVVVAPVFLLLATTLTTFLQGEQVAPPGAVAQASGIADPTGLGLTGVRLLALFAGWFALSFVYMTLPNTRVRYVAALLGGVVAGSLWQSIQILQLNGQIELARYNAIYASFAAIPMLLLWIYLSWSVFLVGAELAFAYQNEPAFTSIARTGKVDQAFREAIAPRLAGRITHAFLRGQRAPSPAELAGELGVAPRTVSQVLESLVAAGLVARTSIGVDDGYLPARDPETMTVLDLLHALRREEGASTPPTRNRLDERVDRVLSALDEENAKSLSNYTLSELARTQTEEDVARPSPGDLTQPAGQAS